MTALPCDGGLRSCTNVLRRVCTCRRCDREGDNHAERFHACDAHVWQASARHERVRDRDAEWAPFAGGAAVPVVLGS